ncbi:hypothetical protein BDF20DRAFT_478939 [Mycotypha africana]|uniref:uncharacterized protein n=1 Tax=Mycotypha africana TaxID=64632 RepID=UPI002300308B|nr:uncharacterized protein BDF20DRAFT_478939 [Mycotypha africana]KAI8979089.1 hypothetical protein BDF20DRAFT_478939 [Mycotypha africana]
MGRRSRRKREWNLTPIEIDEDDLESHRLDANPHYTQSYPEKQVFARTNNFVPTSKKAARLNVGEIFKVAPEFAEHTLSSFRWEQLFTDYIGVQKRQEQFDPLRGNSLLITDDSDNVVLAFFSAGESLSTLVVTSSQKAPFSPQATDHSESFDLPFDSFHVVKYFDLKWPIRQITMSPFTTLPYRLFIVRTTSTLHLFKITQQQKDHSGIHIAQIYHLNLAERTLSNNADIDYSMPVHVEMSPFVPTQFLFITNNGYIALIDAADDNVIHEWTVPIPLPKEKPSGNNKVTQTYVSRWASCGFGPSATSFLVATPETVSEWVPDGLSLRMERLIFSTIDPAVSEEDHQKNKKRKRFKKKDRITSFSTVPSGKPGHRLFCFTTLDYVVVIDSSAYKHPIMILPQSLDETCFSLLKFEETVLHFSLI